jgi:hypothetical protein
LASEWINVSSRSKINVFGEGWEGRSGLVGPELRGYFVSRRLGDGDVGDFTDVGFVIVADSSL